MTVALRCDGDEVTGAGHVTRCLTIAHALRRAGKEVVFVGGYGGVAERLLTLAGIEHRPASTAPAGLPGDITAAVVDVYATTDADLAEAARTRPVVAFRDARGGADAIAPAIALDYHLDAGAPAPRALLGPDFAPLDPALTAARRASRSGPALVALGGSTAGAQALGVLIDALLAETDAEVEVTGALAPAPHPRVRHLGPLPGLTGALAGTGALVCGAGVTAYEAACAGVPAVLVVLAGNQERVAGAFAGLAPILDGREPIASGQARAAVAALPAARIASDGPPLVDGLGGARVRDALLAAVAGSEPPSVQRYRPATVADADLLLQWRNEPAVRAVSTTTDEIAPSEHAAWLQRVLPDPDRTLLIAEREGVPVGSVRFDRDGADSEISITIAPAQRGRHVGAKAIAETTELELAARPALGRVLARVGAANPASRRAFERAGYRLCATEGSWLVLESTR
jgi:spore coat polysaccharide biosynthesis predicted glycosyltransferase SpsG/RimJ/RimL family protein N-acetyltransferase